jgi:integrase
MFPPQWDRPSSAVQPADKPRSASDDRSRQAGQTSAPTTAGIYAFDPVAVRLWDVKQAAEFLHVSVSWVRRHLSELPHSRHGRLIHFNPDDLKRTVTDRKSLEPTRRLMPNNRYQRGGVYLRGKKKMWYGTYRLDTPEGRRPIQIPLGTLRELPTKVSARDKLMQKIAETKTDAKLQTASSMKFSELVKKWEQSEGPGMGETSLEHYTNALRAYVLPRWKDHSIDNIQREDITKLLNSQAAKYSRSSLKSMRLVICLTLAWAERNSYIKRPTGWLDGIKLPRKTGGRKVVRTELEPSQTLAIIRHLKEPYSTLVLFLGLLGRRIEEARGMQPSDLDDNNILHIRRVIYNGRVEELEGEQQLPLDQPEHAELVRRLRSIGADHEWVFRSRKGTPIDPGNARRRYLKPAAQAVGIEIGGWHDFRHTLVRKMRRAGVHPVVVSAIVGHKSVELAPEVYDRANMDEKRQALGLVGKELLPDVLPSGSPD